MILSKLKPILLSLIFLSASLLFVLNTNSIENIPNEDPEYNEKLTRAILVSKENIDDGISALNSLKDLPKYCNYKRNYILARLYEKKNDYDKALSIYKENIDKNFPLKERIIFHYAYLNTQTNNDLTALKYFKKLISDFSSSRSAPQAMYYLVQAQLRLRFTEDALKTLKILKNKYPKTQYGIAANYYLGEYEYNNHNFLLALTYFREYLEQSPDGRFVDEISKIFTVLGSKYLLPSDYTLIGDVYYYKKDFKNTVTFYKIEKRPAKFYKLGYSLFRIGNNSEAHYYLKQFSYRFPNSKNARLSLLLASRLIPSYLKPAFWEEITHDIPSLKYYSEYKRAIIEQNKKKREKLLFDFASKYPQSDFWLDAVWEIIWDKFRENDLKGAINLGETHFNLSKTGSQSRTETRAKIGFWLGKISEKLGDIQKAKEFYSLTEDIFFDNYYSIRSAYRLQFLNGEKDNAFQFQNKAQDNFWTLPNIINPNKVKKHFGITVSELINLLQYDEATELIGKVKSPSKKVTSWLKALNGEYEISINLASSLLTSYKIKTSSKLWQLAYPLYFSGFVFNYAKLYNVNDPYLIFALIRQESHFDKNAKSISDAFGLMQLIKSTARVVALQTHISLQTSEGLFNPKENINLGTFYFNGLINQFGNPVYAIASYNAGPNTVKQWISNSSQGDMDVFIESIPYDETKNYVKKVLANYWTYHKLYG